MVIRPVLTLENIVGLPLDLVFSYVAEDKRSVLALLLSSKWLNKAVTNFPGAWRRITVKLAPGLTAGQFPIVALKITRFVCVVNLKVTADMTRAEVVKYLDVCLVYVFPKVHTLCINHGTLPPEKFPLGFPMVSRFPNVRNLIWVGQLRACHLEVVGDNWPDLESFELLSHRRGRCIRRPLRDVQALTHLRNAKVLCLPQLYATGPLLTALFDLEGVGGRMEELCVSMGKGAGGVLMDRLGELTGLRTLCLGSDPPRSGRGEWSTERFARHDILQAVSGLRVLQELILAHHFDVPQVSLTSFLTRTPARLTILHLGCMESPDPQAIEQLVAAQPHLRILSLAAMSWSNLGPEAVAQFARLPKLEFLRLINFNGREHALSDGVLANAADFRVIRSLKCIFIQESMHDDFVRSIKGALGPDILFHTPHVDSSNKIVRITCCALLYRHLTLHELLCYEFRIDAD